jgi:hypothetical protein
MYELGHAVSFLGIFVLHFWYSVFAVCVKRADQTLTRCTSIGSNPIPTELPQVPPPTPLQQAKSNPLDFSYLSSPLLLHLQQVISNPMVKITLEGTINSCTSNCFWSTLRMIVHLFDHIMGWNKEG